MDRCKLKIGALLVVFCATLLSAPAWAGLRRCGYVGPCASGACGGEVEGHICGFNRACLFDLRICPLDSIRCFCSAGGVLVEDFPSPLIIEDNNPADLSEFLDFDFHMPVVDLVIQFEIDHPFVGDLIMTLTHGNTTVVVVDRPGSIGGAPGCGADLSCSRRIFVGDGAPMPIECGSPTQCATCFPGGEVPEGFYAPNQPLSAFDGQDAFGPWRLTIADVAPGNVGQLCGWSLSIRGPDTTPVQPASWGKIKSVYE